MVSNGSLVELSPEEMHIWGGPVHYISLQAVENEEQFISSERLVIEWYSYERSEHIIIVYP